MAELQWRKSSYSGDNGACVEIAESPTHVHVRDSKDADGGQLRFPPHTWTGFLHTVTTKHQHHA